MINIYIVFFYTGLSLTGTLAFTQRPTLTDIKAKKGLPSWVYTLEILKEAGLTYTKDGKGAIEISYQLNVIDNNKDYQKCLTF
jgi:hypothetical protein